VLRSRQHTITLRRFLLAHSATPMFPDVDQVPKPALLSNLVRQGLYSQADYDKLGNARGISHQQRNYFWYRKVFEAPTQAAVALLRVNKAQFVRLSI